MNFFDEHPLLTPKAQDYLRWRQIVRIHCAKEKNESLKEKLSQTMNTKRSKGVKRVESGLTLLNKTNLTLEEDYAADYFGGFESGEGSFLLSIEDSKFNSFVFKVDQSFDDSVLLLLQEHLGCGGISFSVETLLLRSGAKLKNTFKG